MKQWITIFLTIILSSLTSNAQFFDYGQDRASLKWNSLKSDKFIILYQKDYSYNANLAAKYINWLYNSKNSLNNVPKKIPFVLHSDGGISNGMVAWAPHITNLYMLPPQTPGDSWVRHLTTHEFRHVVQLDKINQGFTHTIYYVLGELAPVIVTGAYVPYWFIEGDATAFETSVGVIGRGRNPEFLNEIKAQILEKGKYSYNKAVLGSYKDFVPDRYALGYYMTITTRLNYGNDVWEKALHRTGHRPLGITPFTTSLQKTIDQKRDSLWNLPGMYELFSKPDSVKNANTKRNARRTIYNDNFSELIAYWKSQPVIESKAKDIPTYNENYTNYLYPQLIGDDSVICYKQGYQESGAIVLLHNQQEQTLSKTAVIYDTKIATRNSNILWSEYRANPRWSQGGRQLLCTYNITNKKYARYKSENNRYGVFATTSGWGCVEILPNGNSDILLLDSTMNEVWRYKGKFGELFIHPCYSNGTIYSVLQTDKGNSLIAIDTLQNQTQLTTTLPYEIDNPSIQGNKLYFRASFNTNNAIYQLNLLNGNISHVIETKYGASMPYAANNTILFSSYTADGYKPRFIAYDTLQENKPEYKKFKYAEAITAAEGFSAIDTSNFNPQNKPFHKFPNMLRYHSWGPIFGDLDEMDVRIGATVYSQNLLNTMALTAGYILLDGYPRGAFYVDATYRGLWPIFSIRGEFGKRRINVMSNNCIYEFMPRYNRLKLTAQLPFQLSRRNWNSAIIPLTRYNLEGFKTTQSRSVTPLSDTIAAPAKLKRQMHNYIDFILILSNKTLITQQNINPKWKQEIVMGYALELNRDGYIGDTWYGSINLNTPGLATNHSITLYGGYQDMSNDTINSYSAKISRPRGINAVGNRYTTFKSTYTMPLLYPDNGLGSILYFRRLYGSIFYDYGTITNNHKTKSIMSYGAELNTDFNILRLTYPLNIGVRAGYETLTKSPFAELLFSITLSL